MKVAHVNLARGFRGGERQTVLTIRALEKLGCEQVLVCRSDSPMRNKLIDVKNLKVCSANHQLAGHFKIGNVDIVHAHDAKGVHWAYIHKRLFCSPYLITRRINSPVKDKFFNDITYGQSSSIVAVSESVRKLIEKRFLRNVDVIHDASSDVVLSSDFCSDILKPYSGFFLIAHAGALVDRDKGQELIIESARKLNKKYSDMVFFMFGEGADECRLKEISRDLNNVLWLGFKENIQDYLGCMDLFVFPSRNEGLGSVLLDVMNLNIPIVATNVGGIPDIIKDHKTGLLIQPNSPEALAEAIEALYLDADLRKKLVSGAEEFVKNYSPEVMAGKYLSLYKRVIGMV